MLFKYCGIIGLLVNIPITICITVIPPLPSPTLPYPPLPPSPPSLLTLPLSPPSLSPHPPSLSLTLPLSPPSLSPQRPLPTLSPHPPSVPYPPSLPHPPFPSLPSLQQIHCPFQPEQSPSYNTKMINKQRNARYPLETPGGLYWGLPSMLMVMQYTMYTMCLRNNKSGATKWCSITMMSSCYSSQHSVSSVLSVLLSSERWLAGNGFTSPCDTFYFLKDVRATEWEGRECQTVRCATHTAACVQLPPTATAPAVSSTEDATMPV